MYCSIWFVSTRFKYAHAMLRVHWDSWKMHVSSSIVSLASLGDINYRIPLDTERKETGRKGLRS
eukprot:scaffold312372_cov27-Tisochrysis_lutea.AAC.1